MLGSYIGDAPALAAVQPGEGDAGVFARDLGVERVPGCDFDDDAAAVSAAVVDGASNGPAEHRPAKLVASFAGEPDLRVIPELTPEAVRFEKPRKSGALWKGLLTRHARGKLGRSARSDSGQQ